MNKNYQLVKRKQIMNHKINKYKWKVRGRVLHHSKEYYGYSQKRKKKKKRENIMVTDLLIMLENGAMNTIFILASLKGYW